MAKTIEEAAYNVLRSAFPDECVELRDALGLSGECGWDGETMPPGRVCIACCERMASAVARAFGEREGE